MMNSYVAAIVTVRSYCREQPPQRHAAGTNNAGFRTENGGRIRIRCQLHDAENEKLTTSLAIALHPDIQFCWRLKAFFHSHAIIFLPVGSNFHLHLDTMIISPPNKE